MSKCNQLKNYKLKILKSCSGNCQKGRSCKKYSYYNCRNKQCFFQASFGSDLSTSHITTDPSFTLLYQNNADKKSRKTYLYPRKYAYDCFHCFASIAQ